MIRWMLLWAGVVGGAAPACAAHAPCPSAFFAGQATELRNPKLTVRTTLLCSDAYAALASGVTHGPIWSAEHLTAASVAIAEQTPREGRFHADDRLPEPDQARLAY